MTSAPKFVKLSTIMARSKIKEKGRIIEILPDLLFKVKLEDGREVLAHLAGKLRFYRIKIVNGDRVLVEMSPYDEKRGRIVYRLK